MTISQPSDFTVEVRYLPNGVTAEQIARVFGDRGWFIDKVVLHRPVTTPKVAGLLTTAIDAVLALEVQGANFETARRMSAGGSDGLHSADGASKNHHHQRALQRALKREETRTARLIGDAAREANVANWHYHGKHYAPHPDRACRSDHDELPFLRGCVPCGVRSRFATAYVSFRYEREREECERSFSTWGHMEALCCVQSRMCRLDGRGNMDVPFSYGLGVGCAACHRSTGAEDVARAKCGVHRAASHWASLDAEVRAMPGWSEVWSNGWIFWWLLGGCCGARWASSVQPIGVVDWKVSVFYLPLHFTRILLTV